MIAGSGLVTAALVRNPHNLQHVQIGPTNAGTLDPNTDTVRRWSGCLDHPHAVFRIAHGSHGPPLLPTQPRTYCPIRRAYASAERQFWRVERSYWLAWSRSTRRRILPDAEFGIASTKLSAPQTHWRFTRSCLILLKERGCRARNITPAGERIKGMTGSMTDDDIEQIKTQLAALDRRAGARRRPAFRPRQGPALAPSELAELESLVASDPKMVKLGTILERRFDAQRRSLLTQRDQVHAAQKEGSAARKAVTAAVNARRQASEYLTKPFVGTRILLDKPFLIWPSPAPWDLEIPNAPGMDLAIWRDSSILPGASWLKIYLDATSTPVPEGYVRPSDAPDYGDGGNRHADFRFYFIWENPYDHPVVVNTSSVLFFYGYQQTLGSPGWFYPNVAELTGRRVPERHPLVGLGRRAGPDAIPDVRRVIGEQVGPRRVELRHHPPQISVGILPPVQYPGG